MGLVREENQDRILAARYCAPNIDHSFFLLAVADGMGGLKDGALCASQALAALVASLMQHTDLPPAASLDRAIRDANAAVYETFKELGGTTLAAILIARRAAAAANVGDSRLYHLSRNSLRQISEDDRIGAELGRIRPDLQQNLDIGGYADNLTQYVGMGKGMEPHIYPNLPEDDSYLLITDGVHRISSGVLSELAATARSASELAFRLIQVANWTGGRDNASVAILSGPQPGRQRGLVQPSDDATIELWDCFGKYEIAWEPSPSSAPAQ